METWGRGNQSVKSKKKLSILSLQAACLAHMLRAPKFDNNVFRLWQIKRRSVASNVQEDSSDDGVEEINIQDNNPTKAVLKLS